MDYLDYLEYLNPNGVRRPRPQDVNPFDQLTDEEFKDRYRLSKNSVRCLIEMVAENLEEPDPRATHTMHVWKKVLVALRFFAEGTLHRETGDLLGVSEATACRCVHQVAATIARNLRKRFIKFPTGPYATQTKLKYYAKYGFPGVLGSLDGTHIRIRFPDSPDKEEYRCRKGFSSINVMCTCDADLRITNIVARWKGSTHDSRAFKNSSLYAYFENNPLISGFLLGDSAYEQSRFLMKPIAIPLTPAEEHYNARLTSARSTIERTFGKWKNRWRCIHSQNTLRFNPVRNCIIIIACAVLHNFGIEREDWGDSDCDEDSGNEDYDEFIENADIPEGIITRNDLIRHHFQ